MASSVFSALASKEMADAIANAKALMTKTDKMSMSDRIQPAGFTDLKIHCTQVSGSIAIARVEELISIWLEDDNFRAVDASVRGRIARDIRILLISDPESETRIQNFDCNFVAGNGSIVVLQMCFKPNTRHLGYMIYRCGLFHSQFTPAAPYVVITHSKSNFFGSKEWSEIEYLPATVTNAHIDAISHATIAMIAMGALEVPPLLDSIEPAP